MDKALLDKMVDRFISWPLPRDFGPDCGISFDGRKDDEWNKNKTWPTGTNLFTAEQARAMLEYVAGDVISNEQRRIDKFAEWSKRADLDPIDMDEAAGRRARAVMVSMGENFGRLVKSGMSPGDAMRASIDATMEMSK